MPIVAAQRTVFGVRIERCVPRKKQVRVTVGDFKSMRPTNTPAYSASCSGGFVQTGAPEAAADVSIDENIEIVEEEDEMPESEMRDLDVPIKQIKLLPVCYCV